MKRQAFVILTALSLLVMLTATSVNAQSARLLKVNIPFEFIVRDKVLPAGEYTVIYMTQGALAIRSVEGNASQTFVTLSTQSSTKRNESTLVFNRYGDQYFLSTIWTAGNATGHKLRKPHTEEQLIRAGSESGNTTRNRQTVSIVCKASNR